MSIHTMDNCASKMAFPLKHYRGNSVVINLELVSEYPPQTLAEWKFVPGLLLMRKQSGLWSGFFRKACL